MFTVSTQGRYALRMVAFLASLSPGDTATKVEIARQEDLTPAYVQQIMLKLRAAGIVRSHRGPGGGFSLAKPAGEITVADVLKATEGEIAIAPCLEGVACDRAPTCPTRPLWARTTRMLDELFEGTTVASLEADAEDQFPV